MCYFHSAVGHFTQMVWKDSKELGVGKAIKGQHVFVVCNFRPMGNQLNGFKENVLPLKKWK